jgi:hypothetical protein
MICPKCGLLVIEIRNINGHPMCKECCNKEVRQGLISLCTLGLIERDGQSFRFNRKLFKND